MKKFHSLQKCLLISYLAHPKLYSKTAMEESFVVVFFNSLMIFNMKKFQSTQNV